ncbi:MAG: GNAT family N-acetyltransferase [Deltaproteobacteria bacterium]|nr:GNAT family N-acetyltransferase [Deltaproteobacteria bacterium]
MFLDGKHVALKSLSPNMDLSDYLLWVADQETTRYMEVGKRDQTAEALRKYIRSFDENDGRMLLGVFLKDSGKHVGNITFQNIDCRNRSGEIGIMIGEKEARGHGYGSEAIHLVVEYVFERLNLHRLTAGAVVGNEGSLRAFEKCGFIREGTFREAFYLKGEYLDVIRMGCLRRDYDRVSGE